MDQKEPEFHALAAGIGLNRESLTVLNTILDVLIDIHMDGKSAEERKAYLEKVDERMVKYREAATDTMHDFSSQPPKD